MPRSLNVRQKKILIILNEQYTTKKSVSNETDFFVVLPGFEPGQTEPKPVVLPLHHRTILIVLSFEERCKGSVNECKNQIFSIFLSISPLDNGLSAFGGYAARVSGLFLLCLIVTVS